MPLVYCNYGIRDYRKKPISINTRGYWEFQCTLSGKNRLQKLGKTVREYDNDPNFWISTPDSAHGWTSLEKEPSEIAVFHFSEVPESLSCIFKGRTTVSTRLDQQTLKTIADMAQKMMPLVYSPNYTSNLQYEICCRQLCLIFLHNTEFLLENIPWDHNKQTVRASIAWYCTYMNEGVGIQETAEKMGYSVSQLRKIFIRTRGEGPCKVFEECRMNRARELIQHGTMSMIEISMECGYNNQSSFSRAFRKYNSMSPLQFKKLCQSTRHPLSIDQIREHERK
jgi:AraC-like DNA-binding protein